MKRYVMAVLSLCTLCCQAQRLTLDDAIRIAQENSFDGKVAQYSFLSNYWTYRSFKADMLPAVNLSGGLMDFNHSLVETRNFEDGKVQYVSTNTLSNSLTLSLDQKIALTGGTISLQSYLYRLDQFSYKEKTYNTQPLRISYTQPLMAFNSLKWEKKTAPLEYQKAQRDYITAMEDITLRAAGLFFSAIAAQSNYVQAESALKDREALFAIAQQRLELGTTTKSEVLQMELSLLNAKVSVSNSRLSLDDAKYNLFSYLRVTDYETAELLPPCHIPDLLLSFEDVLQRSIANSPHSYEQRLQMLEAERALAQAKSNRGLQMTLHGEVGLTNSNHTLRSAYSSLKDNEVVGLTLSLPIFDWGVRKGRVKMAQARLDVVKAQVERNHEDYLQQLRHNVTQFNAQPVQCRDAQRAREIAEERYDITRQRFESGSISVTELNTAQQEMESAKMQYISQLQTFWTDYYTIRRATLYDWINKSDIKVDFEKLTNK
ncbi:MAG: TolC family protein [Bacteroidaceae bacterium]|nr:TolC family protein [Bacteroidaceae bacterium]